jgi:hypothetical protein
MHQVEMTLAMVVTVLHHLYQELQLTMLVVVAADAI